MKIQVLLPDTWSFPLDLAPGPDGFPTGLDGRTLLEVRSHLRQHQKEGCACPACGQHVRLYRYSLHRSLAECLMGLVMAYDELPWKDGWVRIQDIKVRDGTALERGGHIGKARHWNLVESGARSAQGQGWWRPTELGLQFTSGEARVPSHVLLYNNQRLGFDGDLISFAEALKQPVTPREWLGRPGGANNDPIEEL